MLPGRPLPTGATCDQEVVVAIVWFTEQDRRDMRAEQQKQAAYHEARMAEAFATCHEVTASEARARAASIRTLDCTDLRTRRRRDQAPS
jgi:hypothetical protein